MTDHNLIILAAGRPYSGELPVLLTQVNGQTLFDWQINALSATNPSPQVVVGFAAEKFKELSGRARLCVNANWETSGSGYSLLTADLSDESIIVSYADILYRTKVIEEISQSDSDVTLTYDSCWKQRFFGRAEQDLIATEKVIVFKDTLLGVGRNLPVDLAQGEFIGLVHFQGRAVEYLRELQNKNNTAMEKIPLSGLVELLRLQGFSVSVVDVQGDWAELNEPKDVAHFILGTKAETLDRLGKMVKKSVVLDQVAFTVADWQENSQTIIHTIQNVFNGLRLAVRSSAKSEDAFTHSNAGAYTSLLNVDLKRDLQDAIVEVINSYADCQLDDQVLVQPMLQDVLLSGVAFTCSLEHSAPFYIINYDESGDTDSITSGVSKQHKCLYLRKDAELSNVPEQHLVPLIEAIKEVESILNYDALDIEFALDNRGAVYLLQVRPIATDEHPVSVMPSKKVIEVQKNASDYWLTLQAARPKIKGDKALFGSMPDWNPAEIIGTNPGQLAVSLYKHLILNDVWARQRSEYGYKDVRPQPLLYMFAGKPYVDIRASFNTFIPKVLSDNLSEKLVNFYLSWLEAHPWLHDKVEFEVVPTCYGPMFSKWETRLIEKLGLIEEEVSQLKEGLLSITQGALTRTSKDLAVLTELQMSHNQVTSHKTLANSEKIQVLLENCKELGTLPFAHLARSGFVAVTLLKEGVEAGWLSIDAKEGFMETVQTVSSELSKDAWHTAQGKKSWGSFVAEYGHLRPGTYDITSPAYSDNPEQFLRPLIKHASQPKSISNQVAKWQSERGLFFTNLRAIGLEATDSDFERFLHEAIEGREKAKFLFSRSLSEVLRLLEKEGAKYKLSTEELANLDLNDLLAGFNAGLTVENLSVLLKSTSHRNQQDRLVSAGCNLPPLLCNPVDFSAFILTEEKPNYIGSNRITAPVVHIGESTQEKVNVDGCIVVISQADPGYDWLFGRNIAGLITKFGGANSHMAIRSAEFGLPAAIGVGEQLYLRYKIAKTIELDAAGETIRVLH